MTSLWLYLCIKLDDLRELFNNEYGITIIVAILCLVTIFIITTDSEPFDKIRWDNDGEEGEEKKKYIKKIERLSKCVLCVFLFQFLLNIIGAVLPSTSQMAVIYTISCGVESKTFKSLKSLDADFANYLQTQTKEWLKNNGKKVMSNMKGESNE